MKKRRRIPNERGTSAIELVLVLPILLPILFGIVEYGWLFKKQMDLNNAVAEGVRVVVQGSDNDMYLAANAMVEILSEDDDFEDVFLSLLDTMDLNYPEDPDRVKLSVSGWPHESLTGFFPETLLPSTLSATAVMAYP